MTDTIIMLLFALGIKHIICNFILRSFIVALENKLIKLGIPATGIIYIWCHTTASIIILNSFSQFTPTIVLVAIVASLIHYLIDQTNKQTDSDEIDNIMTTNTKWLTGFDQCIHGFVYLVKVAVLISIGIIR